VATERLASQAGILDEKGKQHFVKFIQYPASFRLKQSDI
jgi:hypothetical protein